MHFVSAGNILIKVVSLLMFQEPWVVNHTLNCFEVTISLYYKKKTEYINNIFTYKSVGLGIFLILIWVNYLIYQKLKIITLTSLYILRANLFWKDILNFFNIFERLIIYI